MSFASRKAAADKFEAALPERFKQNGWYCEPFGQALLPEHARDALKRFQSSDGNPTLVRWMPDRLVWKPPTKLYGVRVALIDAKACQPGYEHYPIEDKAIETMLVYQRDLHTPTFFVFSEGFKVLRADKAVGFPGPWNGSGSGTPFTLVHRSLSSEFDEVFDA